MALRATFWREFDHVGRRRRYGKTLISTPGARRRKPGFPVGRIEGLFRTLIWKWCLCCCIAVKNIFALVTVAIEFDRICALVMIVYPWSWRNPGTAYLSFFVCCWTLRATPWKKKCLRLACSIFCYVTETHRDLCLWRHDKRRWDCRPHVHRRLARPPRSTGCFSLVTGVYVDELRAYYMLCHG